MLPAATSVRDAPARRRPGRRPDGCLLAPLSFQGPKSHPGHRGQLAAARPALGGLGAERLEVVVHQDVVGRDRLLEGLGGRGLDRGGEDADEGDQGQPDHQGGGGGGGPPRVAHGVLAGQGAGQPERAGERPADHPGQRPGDQRARMATPKNTITAPEATLTSRLPSELEQPGQQQGHADGGDEHAEHDPALAEVGRGEGRLGLEGGDRRHPGRLAAPAAAPPARSRRCRRPATRSPCAAGTGCRWPARSTPRNRLSSALQAVGDQHAEAEADQRGRPGRR